MSLISNLRAAAFRRGVMSTFFGRVAIASLTLPLAFPVFADAINQTLPPRVAQALKANKMYRSIPPRR